MRLIKTTALAALATLVAHTAMAQGYQMPPNSARCPSKWGAGDQQGSANWAKKPEIVLKAARLIKTGQVFELGALLSPDPKEAFINGGRQFNIYTKPALPEPGARTENEELVITELGQIGTQIDALAHQMWGDSFYNCFKLKEIGGRSGFKALGADQIGSLMTRGVLVDVAALKGVAMLPDSYIITAADLEQALARQKLKLEPGDAVIIHTGWGVLMGKDNPRYGQRPSGISLDAGRWLVKQDPMLVGADTCCVEVRPPEPGLSLPIHSMMLIENGILLLENLMLEDMAAAKAYETAFIVQPLKIKGATGSTVAPMAVR